MPSRTRATPPPSSNDYVELPRRFFARPSVALARALIGKVLVHDSREGRTAGVIVETEAYDESDPASHSARGPTARNRVMFGPAGHAYVYFSYGTHWCMNVVASRAGHGAAVLLRALAPYEGVPLMAKRRGLDANDARALRRLCRGPGCLTQALGIGGEDNGADLCAGALRVVALATERRRAAITAGPRIGISKAREVPWRFILSDSPYVSGGSGGSGGSGRIS